MKSVELFAGAGGLAIGTALAGFKHQAVIEWDRWCCDTIRENQQRGFALMKEWPLFEGDVRAFDYGMVGDGIELLAGGPPCQPFSICGKHRGHLDERDMFPEAVRAVRELRPKAFIVENVRGLTRQAFSNYFQYVCLQFTHPEVARKSGEAWMDHFARLERHETRGKARGLTYNVVHEVLNAADYGVPQKRERVFIVGFRSDLGIEWSFPKPTHSEDLLLIDQWVTGNYWDRHKVSAKAQPKLTGRLRQRVERLCEEDLLVSVDSPAHPWATVRDALADLPLPTHDGRGPFANHKFQPGARPYVGHTGSPLDEPAKTLKAGDHGVPGGENMMALPDGSVRYFTVRESARLQTFPDQYVFHGAWSECMRQLGNAVSIELGRIVAESVGKRLRQHARSAQAARRQSKVRAAA
jgi:DNA (cytosine-5)-methyltransferase 1